MILKTKYNNGDLVWVINPKTAKIVKREITGIRAQSFSQNTTDGVVYAFVKDWHKDKENPTIEDCFWVSEEKVFETKAHLIASIK